jgi:DmsE family decaheme c-type cytochrome
MAGSRRRVLVILCCLSGALLCGAAAGETRLADCLDCHTESASAALHAIDDTVHGSLAGGGNASCTACHGASEAHRKAPVLDAPDVSFGPTWRAEPEARSAGCLGCHQQGRQLLWAGGPHQRENLACDDCHSAHQARDPVLDERQSEQLCLGCHPRVRAEIQLPSRHPIAEGKTACRDCHNPHGGLGDGALHQVSLNDNCLSCHQEKRGPFLWEHPPVAEDCSLCHRPHGSVNSRLLNARGPALCQQCHAAAFHPSLPYGGGGVAGGTANQNLLGKNCLNCHSQIHGSNHPSGARLTR